MDPNRLKAGLWTRHRGNVGLMDSTLLVLIIVVALVVIAALVLIPRMSGKRKLEREVARKRDERVEEHRSEADSLAAEAERLERAAKAQRLEAEAHAERAELHERGLADDQLHREIEAEREEGHEQGTTAPHAAAPGGTEHDGRFTSDGETGATRTPPRQD